MGIKYILILVAIIGLTITWLGSAGANPQECIKSKAHNVMPQTDIVFNGCTYPVNLYYCTSSDLGLARGTPERCANKLVPENGFITSLNTSVSGVLSGLQQRHISYFVCRAPQKPFEVSNNSFECR